MAARRTNLGLAIAVPLAAISGLVAMGVGTEWWIPAAIVHGAAGLSILVLSPWKQRIVRRGLAHQRSSRSLSLLLVAMSLTAIGSGVAHTLGATVVGPLTIMQVHVGSGLGALLLTVIHIRSRPIRPHRADLSRRTAMRAAGVAAVSAIAWIGWEGTLRTFNSVGASRRFTGSHERGSFDPSAMPATVWLDDRAPDTSDDWTLTVAGRTLTMEQLRDLPKLTVTATLDCTSGWYSTQVWSGIPMSELLAGVTARTAIVRSATGYRRALPRRDWGSAVLAMEVAGEPLSKGHGAPIRLVVPGRRGFWWVKWVDRIDTSDMPWWAQLPFPAT